jgi:Spy/CpxP family protein refolding chaperone
MSPRSITLLTAAIVAFGGAIAIANPTPFSAPVAQVPADLPGMGRGGGWLRDLDLTPEQIQQIQQIRRQRKDELAGQRQAMRQAMEELRQLMASDAPADQIRQKHAETRALRQKLADAQFENLLAIREVLTPEQRRKFAEQMQHRREQFRNRMRSFQRSEYEDNRIQAKF